MSQDTTAPETITQFFEKTTKYFYLLAVLLVVYLVVFIGFGRYLNTDGKQDSVLSYLFDFVFLGCIFGYLVYCYSTMSPSEQKTAFNYYYLEFLKMYGDDWALISVMVFVACFYLLLFILRMPLTVFKPFSILLIECVSWFMLATLTINDCLKYFFHVDILNTILSSDLKLLLNTAYIDASGNPFDINDNPLDASGNPIYSSSSIFNSLNSSGSLFDSSSTMDEDGNITSSIPTTSPSITTLSPSITITPSITSSTTTVIPSKTSMPSKMDISGNLLDSNGEKIDSYGNVLQPAVTPEVFNIPDHLYKYEDAQAICQVYDARLATYDEMEKAYENGADWCNYGWSAEQMAYFPTQKNTWDDLQKSENKNKCGRPGVNGGYFENTDITFGVNCFGVKPKPTKEDLLLMEMQRDRPIPKTIEEKLMDEKVAYWKEHESELLKVSSFNRDNWSRY